jgi:hypothetical protein
LTGVCWAWRRNVAETATLALILWKHNYNYIKKYTKLECTFFNYYSQNLKNTIYIQHPQYMGEHISGALTMTAHKMSMHDDVFLLTNTSFCAVH